MYIEHVHAELHGLYTGLGNGIRYIMVFEVEKDLCLVHLDKVDDLCTAMGEELLANLEHAHVILELLDELLGFLKMLQVKGQYHPLLGVHAVHKRLLFCFVLVTADGLLLSAALFLLLFREDVKKPRDLILKIFNFFLDRLAYTLL